MTGNFVLAQAAEAVAGWMYRNSGFGLPRLNSLSIRLDTESQPVACALVWHELSGLASWAEHLGCPVWIQFRNSHMFYAQVRTTADGISPKLQLSLALTLEVTTSDPFIRRDLAELANASVGDHWWEFTAGQVRRVLSPSNRAEVWS